MSESSKKLHIAINGNLGVGKSTVANLLVDTIQCISLAEDPRDYTFANDMFLNPSRWAFTNQVQFLVKKLELQLNTSKKDYTLIQEMDAHSTFFIWTPVLRDLGYINDREFSLLEDMFKLISQNRDISIPDAYILVEASTKVAMERIMVRSRNYELSQRDETYNLIKKLDSSLQQFPKKISQPILSIPTDKLDLINNHDDQRQLRAKVNDFLMNVPIRVS